jgi:hypothetical protein
MCSGHGTSSVSNKSPVKKKRERHYLQVRSHATDAKEWMMTTSFTDASRGEEEFSWEDDEDESPAPRPNSAAATVTASGFAPQSIGSHESISPPRVPSNPTLQSIASAASPRLSSEDGSYDIVGEDSAAGTRGQSPAPAAPTPASAKKQSKGDGDDSDSDWE